MKLHLGCGNRDFGKDWINIDKYDHGLELSSNDVTRLPQNDNTVDLIYNCGLIPYFDDYQIEDVIKEWCRVLKKNAILRVSTPDFEILSKLYTEKLFPLKNLIGPIYGRWNPVNDNICIYQNNTYDFDKLSNILERCGFHNIKRYNWRNTEHAHIDDYSQAYLPHMDKDNGTSIMLNIECKKI